MHVANFAYTFKSSFQSAGATFTGCASRTFAFLPLPSDSRVWGGTRAARIFAKCENTMRTARHSVDRLRDRAECPASGAGWVDRSGMRFPRMYLPRQLHRGRGHLASASISHPRSRFDRLFHFLSLSSSPWSTDRQLPRFIPLLSVSVES